MTQREEFEKWALESKRAYKDEKHGLCFYEPGVGSRYWEAWQASRAVALEDALIACNGEALGDPTESADDIAYDYAVDDCRNAIKKLKGKA